MSDFQNQYLDIQTFIKNIILGDFLISQTIEINNITRNTKLQISFIKHCLILCQKYNIHLMKLLSIIRYKIKEKLSELFLSNVYVSQTVNMIIKEWGYNDITSHDILDDGFKEQEDISDTDDIFDYDILVKENDDVNNIKDEIIDLESDIQERQLNSELIGGSIEIPKRMKLLHGRCIDCNNRLTEYHSDIKIKDKLINPKYYEVLLDLSAKNKSYYLENNHNKDEENIILSSFVTTQNDSEIPENIHNIFMNYLLIINYIHKELKFIMNSFIQLIESINEKHKKISTNIYKLNVDDVPNEENMLSKLLSDLFGYSDKTNDDSDILEQLNDDNNSDILEQLSDDNNSDILEQLSNDNNSDILEDNLDTVKDDKITELIKTINENHHELYLDDSENEENSEERSDNMGFF